MTTLSWDLVGGNPAPGEPGTYDHLAGRLAETANNAAEARSKLDRFSSSVDSSIWRGEAADAFREKIQELPPKLQKLHESYDTASKALSDYGRVLADLQPRANTLLEQAHAARNDENTQRQRREAAQAQPGADPAAVQASTATMDNAIDAAQTRLRDIRSQIDHIRDDRTGAEGRAVGGLHHAHDQGIPNDSWWERAWHDIDKWIDEHADILKTISGILKVVSAIAGLLSFIPFLAPICGPIALIAGGAALLLDAALCATGNGDWKALLVDAALMALPGVGKLARGGIRFGSAAAKGERAAVALQKTGKGLPRTGVARFDRLVHGSKDYARWSKNLERRGYEIVEKKLDLGNAANVLPNKIMEIDPRQFRYIDLLHESRHIAQAERAASQTPKLWQKHMRALWEKGAYEYELRVARSSNRARMGEEFSKEYVDWAGSRIQDYWTRAVQKKFSYTPNLLRLWR